jgi:hypothetical protein
MWRAKHITSATPTINSTAITIHDAKGYPAHRQVTEHVTSIETLPLSRHDVNPARSAAPRRSDAVRRAISGLLPRRVRGLRALFVGPTVALAVM